MDLSEIEAKVIAFIQQEVSQEKPIEINAATSFSELGLDSLDTAQLFFDAEDKFGISFDMEKASNITCVGDIVNYIAAHQTAQS